jgi:hypothetical protein
MTWHLRFDWLSWPGLGTWFRQAFRRQGRPRAREAGWHRDPLAHPVLQQMSERELADLPFNPRCISAD